MIFERSLMYSLYIPYAIYFTMAVELNRLLGIMRIMITMKVDVRGGSLFSVKKTALLGPRNYADEQQLYGFTVNWGRASYSIELTWPAVSLGIFLFSI